MHLLKVLSKHIDRSAAVRAVAVALVFVLTLSICGFDARCDEIRGNVLRLHVLANSDSEEDQALKLKIRDALLTESEILFSNCKNEQEAAARAEKHLDDFQKIALQVINDSGFAYPVKVEVAETWFETRDYGEFTLPAGTYEALRVIIGEGEGHNWWCVMFPSICLPAAMGENRDFKGVLKEDTAEIVEQPKHYKARFKVVEIFEKARRSIADIFS